MRVLVPGLCVFGAGYAHAANGWAVTQDARQLGWAAAIVAGYIIFSLLIALRRRAQKSSSAAVSAVGGGKMLVTYASQTGYAEELARSTLNALEQAQLSAQMLPIADVQEETLKRAQVALFIVSTTGEGDPPDHAARFISNVMHTRRKYGRLRFAVLALGDSSFARYCAFGDAVDQWLSAQGGQRLFDAIRVDSGNPEALAEWSRRLGEIAGTAVDMQSAAVACEPWRLHRRELANPSSAFPAYYVSLQPHGAMPQWQAGDISVIRQRNTLRDVDSALARLGAWPDPIVDAHGAASSPLRDALQSRQLPQTSAEFDALSNVPPSELVKSLAPLPWREFSIASMPDEGRMELLIRQVRKPDGRLGVVSGWLTQDAPLGADVDVKIRSNAAFHPPASEVPMILVGNGTGIAGLRAHIAARAGAGTRNWLIFGERTAAGDFFYGGDIARWRRMRVLERADFAFSRDQDRPAYVQDVLRQRAAEVRDWVAAGAAIYVCGSLRGMADGVHAALTEILGAEAVEALQQQGRYRRDVY